jgi:hypothetical protein
MQNQNEKKTVKALLEQFNNTFTIDQMNKNKELRQLRSFLIDRMGQMRGNVELAPPSNLMGHYFRVHLGYSPQANS